MSRRPIRVKHDYDHGPHPVDHSQDTGFTAGRLFWLLTACAVAIGLAVWAGTHFLRLLAL